MALFSVHNTVFSMNGKVYRLTNSYENHYRKCPFNPTSFENHNRWFSKSKLAITCSTHSIPSLLFNRRHTCNYKLLLNLVENVNMLIKLPLTAVECFNLGTLANLFPPGLKFKGKRQDIKTFLAPASLRCGWASYLQQNFVKLWAP